MFGVYVLKLPSQSRNSTISLLLHLLPNFISTRARMATESNKRYTLTQPQGEFLKSYLLRYIDADVQDDGDTDEVVEEVYEDFVKHFRILKPDGVVVVVGPNISIKGNSSNHTERRASALQFPLPPSYSTLP